jgi:hypothetical protein
MNMDAGGLHEFHDWNQMAEETMQTSCMRIAPFQVTEFNQVAGLAELPPNTDRPGKPRSGTNYTPSERAT